MSVQTSYTESPDVAVEGMLSDNGVNAILSGKSATRKLVSVAVTASNSQVYTITINGTAFVYTADGSATTGEIVLGLKALINAGSEPVLASGTDTPLLIESTIDGVDGDFTYSDSAGTGALVETVLVEQCQEIPFGKFVCMDERDSDDDAVRLPRQSADVTGGRARGIVIEDKAREANAATFAANTMVPVLSRGRCYVKVEEAVAKGDPVYVRYAAGGLGLGSFRTSTGSSEAALLPRATFETAAGINGMAVVQYNR